MMVGSDDIGATPRSDLGNRYSQYAPAGFNGRFVYVKVGVLF